MDQHTILFDNQYHADIVDNILREFNDRTWYRSMTEQKTACQTEILSGPVSDFKQDEALNTKMGFPAGSYTYFLPRKLTNHQYQKEILDKFIIPKTLISLKDTFTSKYFVFQYLFLLGDYVFINLKLCITQNGTYLVIEDGTTDGISDTRLKEMIDNYNNPYCDNRWTLEIRPKTSFCYTETTRTSLVDGTKLYLNKFTTQQFRVAPNSMVDWKVCITYWNDDPNLLRMTSATLKEDEGGKYLEVTQVFSDYLANGGSFIAHCYVYAEPYRVGYAISPNYNGPTGYLKTMFDEYIATVDNRRLKVLAQVSEDGWETVSGSDIKFDDLTDAIAVGFMDNYNWIAIPIMDHVSPIHPGNFRIWEYEPETDTFGRMNATSVTARFPNIYKYNILSECSMFYIEWIRADEEVSYCKFDDFTKEYRDYIGIEFARKLLHNELIDVIQNFKPLEFVYNDYDYISSAKYPTVHDYNLEKAKELLHETNLWYSDLQKQIAERNRVFKTHVFQITEFESFYNDMVAGNTPEYLNIRFTDGSKLNHAYTVYVDGKFIGDYSSRFDKFDLILSIPSKYLTQTSEIIIDAYLTENEQYATTVKVDANTDHALLPYEYKGHSISGSDITFYDSAGLRVDPNQIGFGMYAAQYIVQYPTKMIDWEGLGLDPSSEEIASRIYLDEDTGAEMLTFEFIVPNEYAYLYLKTIENYFLLTLDPAYLMVKSGEVFVECPAGTSFSKKINPLELSVVVPHKFDALGRIGISNSDVYRQTYNADMGAKNEMRLGVFYGSNNANRFLVFKDGVLTDPSTYNITTSNYVGKALKVDFKEAPTAGTVGGLIYLPFPVDIIQATSDANGFINIAGTGLCGYTGTEIVFRDNLRYNPNDIIEITPQILKCSTPYATFTFIRVHRDSNIFEFEDTQDFDFLDKLFVNDPAFAEAIYGYTN